MPAHGDFESLEEFGELSRLIRDNIIFPGIRGPDRKSTAGVGNRIITVPVRAADFGGLGHMFPAPDIITAFIIKADIEVLGGPGRHRWRLPLAHLLVAMRADGFILLHLASPFSFMLSIGSVTVRWKVGKEWLNESRGVVGSNEDLYSGISH